MNKYLLLAGAALIGFGGMSSVYADEHEHVKEERHAEDHAEDEAEHDVEHYDGVEITSVDVAFKVLEDKTKEIGDVLENNEELEFLELEEIHEVSYSLEAAIDYIRDHEAADEDKIEAVDKAVQAVHHTSEDQDELQLRQWFQRLKTALTELNA